MTKAGSDNYGFFEELYGSENEPFRYSVRAIEVLRHERIVQMIEALAPRSLLEVGCSLGLLTEKLMPSGRAVTALDLSPTAVQRARDRFRARNAPEPEWLIGSVLDLPIDGRAFDVVLASDGPMSWYLSAPERARAYEQIHRALTPDGHAIITEYMHPRRFKAFVEEIAASPLRVASVNYLYDRPWYQMERSLQPIADNGFVRKAIASTHVARGISAFSSVFGKRAARHVIVVGRPLAAEPPIQRPRDHNH